MKSAIKIISIIIAFMQISLIMGQNQDSVKNSRNEIGVNVLPVISILSDASPGEFSRFGISWRRYVTEKSVIRTGVSFYPFSNNNTNGTMFMGPTFYTLTDTFLIYHQYTSSRTIKPQLNLGYEFVFAGEKLKHSFGADLFVNYAHIEQRNAYYWLGKSSDFSAMNLINNPLTNKVDTLGNTLSIDETGIGIQLFYNIRMPFSKHWMLSATLGPSMQFTMRDVKSTEWKNGKTEKAGYNNFDFQSILFSDLSICYRF